MPLPRSATYTLFVAESTKTPLGPEKSEPIETGATVPPGITLIASFFVSATNTSPVAVFTETPTGPLNPEPSETGVPDPPGIS